MTTTTETLEASMNALDYAKLVRIDYSTDTVYIWKGYHTINIYALPEWANIDMFSMGDFASDTVPLAAVEEAITHRIQNEEDAT